MRFRTVVKSDSEGQVRVLALGSFVLTILLVWALWNLQQPEQEGEPAKSLRMYCAAGIKAPVEEIARLYQEEFGIRIDLQYGGSGTLLSQLEVQPAGVDLYLAADDSYVRLGREKGLLAESLRLSFMHPVIGVPTENPQDISRLEDLQTEGLRIGMANPDAAAVGKVVRQALESSGDWEWLQSSVKVFKPTVMDLANDLKVGSLDAGIVWNTTVNQYPELAAVEVPVLKQEARTVAISICTQTKHATSALHFSRYMQARDRGGPVFEQHGYQPEDGDRWSSSPKLVLYAGSMFNQAIEQTIQDFAQREGVEVDRVYNGCGILVSQMRAGGSPDVYFSCDEAFMSTVQERFFPAVGVSENHLVILVQKGNPKKIRGLANLSLPGLRVGLAHPDKSALGFLTQRLLQEQELLEALKKSGNWVQDAPQGDFLVNALRTGALDAAVVYRSNASFATKDLDILTLEGKAALAKQPFAIALKTDFPHTAQRLLNALTTAQSRQQFEELGFVWKYQTP